MVNFIVVRKADLNHTVEELMKNNPKYGGDCFLDMNTGDIIKIEERKAEIPKTKKKK